MKVFLLEKCCCWVDKHLQGIVCPGIIRHLGQQIGMGIVENGFFGVAQGLADQACIVLAHLAVAAFHEGGVDGSAAPRIAQQVQYLYLVAQHDARRDLHYLALVVPLFAHLGVAQPRVKHSYWSRPSAPALVRGMDIRTIVFTQDIRVEPPVGREEGGVTVAPALQFLDEQTRLFLRPLPVVKGMHERRFWQNSHECPPVSLILTHFDVFFTLQNLSLRQVFFFFG